MFMAPTLSFEYFAGQVVSDQRVFAEQIAHAYRLRMDLSKSVERRRANLRMLMRELGRDELADRLGCSPSYVSHMCAGTRPVSEKAARKYEKRLGKPPGWLDVDHETLAAAESPVAAQELIELLLELPDDERAFWIRTIRGAPRRE